MELADYVRILRRRWWIIVVAVLLTASSAYVFSKLQDPEYTSTAEVIILPARPDWGLAQSAKLLLRSYMTVIDSDSTAQEVIDELPLSTTPERLRSNAHFAALDDRMVIKIEIEDYDGDQANRIAAEWAQQLIDWRNEKNAQRRKEDRVYATLRDDPTSSQSWPPRRGILEAAGGVFGLAIAGAVVSFLEWLEADATRTRQDGEQRSNLAAALAVLGRRWWIIVVSVVLTTGGALALSILPPQYTSTADIVIEPQRPELGLAQTAKMLLRTYMTVIDSRRTADAVLTAQSLRMSPDQLLANARFTAEEDRMVIKIEIKDHDGDQANRIADEWARQLKAWLDDWNIQQRKEDRVYAELRDYPTYVQSWPPGRRTLLAAGTISGLMLAGAVILLLEWLKGNADLQPARPGAPTQSDRDSPWQNDPI